MTQKQAVAISQLAYLDKPPGVTTLGGLVKYYEENMNPKELETWTEYFGTVNRDDYLKNLKIVGYQNNNDKSGFVGYAFEDATSSGDGVVAFRGSDDTLDWINNAIAWFTPISPQEIQAALFAVNKENGAGNLENIDYTGHSLGGYLATIMALFDPRAKSGTPFNPYGTLNPTTLSGKGGGEIWQKAVDFFRSLLYNMSYSRCLEAMV